MANQNLDEAKYKIINLEGKTADELFDLALELVYGQYGKKPRSNEDHRAWGRMQGKLIGWQDEAYALVYSQTYKRTQPIYVQCTKCGKVYSANQKTWQIRHYHDHLFGKI